MNSFNEATEQKFSMQIQVYARNGVISEAADINEIENWLDVAFVKFPDEHKSNVFNMCLYYNLSIPDNIVRKNDGKNYMKYLKDLTNYIWTLVYGEKLFKVINEKADEELSFGLRKIIWHAHLAEKLKPISEAAELKLIQP